MSQEGKNQGTFDRFRETVARVEARSPEQQREFHDKMGLGWSLAWKGMRLLSNVSGANAGHNSDKHNTIEKLIIHLSYQEDDKATYVNDISYSDVLEFIDSRQCSDVEQFDAFGVACTEFGCCISDETYKILVTERSGGSGCIIKPVIESHGRPSKSGVSSMRTFFERDYEHDFFGDCYADFFSNLAVPVRDDVKLRREVARDCGYQIMLYFAQNLDAAQAMINAIGRRSPADAASFEADFGRLGPVRTESFRAILDLSNLLDETFSIVDLEAVSRLVRQ